jgi:hypothetical protein
MTLIGAVQAARAAFPDWRTQHQWNVLLCWTTFARLLQERTE